MYRKGKKVTLFKERLESLIEIIDTIKNKEIEHIKEKMEQIVNMAKLKGNNNADRNK